MKTILLTLMILLGLTGFSQVANYGYTATTSTWAANSSPTVLTGLSSGVNDVLSAATNIGFTFTYNGVAYTQFKASTNGFLTFNTANTLAQPTNNLNTSTDRVILAVLWDDNQTGSTGNVNYKLTGTTPNQVMTIEWKALRWNKLGYSAGTIDCQIKLYETTNAIEYIYNRGSYQSLGNSTGISASIGLGGATSGDFLSLSDIAVSPTKSTTVETSAIGASPTNFLTKTAAQANTAIPNGTKYRFYPPLANDNCSGGSSLTVNSASTCTTTSLGTTVGATQSIAACVGTADDDVWYSFVATQPIHLLTETPGTIGDAVIQAYSGTCASLTTIACVNDETSGNETSTLTGLTIGSTYYVRVHSFANGSGQGTFTMCVTTPPTILTSGSLSTFNSCSGSVSDEQSYSVYGSGLQTNVISITAPTGYEISKVSGGTFTSSTTINPSTGVVNSTTIYVRLASNASGSTSGNVTNSSINATTQNIAVIGVVSATSVGGTVSSDQNVSSGSNAATINLSGYTGSIIKWERSTISDFSTATDVANTTTEVIGTSMGAITQTLYYRAVIQNGTCPTVNSSYVTITVVTALPIELIYFKGIPGERENVLEWESASEYNNDYYTVYYMSNDNLIWKDGVHVAGAGTSSLVHKYRSTLPYDYQGINYYMLEQTDTDGKHKTYVDLIVSINNTAKATKIISRITNSVGQEVDDSYKGIIFINFSDGSTIIQYR
jgi:hypothetical protein